MRACLDGVDSARRAGAAVAVGGGTATTDTKGLFVEPTVLVDVPWDSEIASNSARPNAPDVWNVYTGLRSACITY
jgi:hypothetical protein